MINFWSISTPRNFTLVTNEREIFVIITVGIEGIDLFVNIMYDDLCTLRDSLFAHNHQSKLSNSAFTMLTKWGREVKNESYKTTNTNNII